MVMRRVDRIADGTSATTRFPFALCDTRSEAREIARGIESLPPEWRDEVREVPVFGAA